MNLFFRNDRYFCLLCDKKERQKKYMEKHIILETHGAFSITIHACPNAIGKFQWYLVDDPNDEKEYILNGQTHESITITSADINNKYQNKWLCCKCKIGDDNYIEGCVYLSNNFYEMITVNQFNTMDIALRRYS